MNFYVTEDEKRLIDERIRLPPTRSIRQIRTDSFPQHRIHASLYIFLQCLLLRISTLCLLTIKVLKNLLHLPTSANFHQDITLHILMVHQLQETSKHNLIRVWFLNSFLLPNSQCEAYSLHWYKHQYCCTVDCILQILFSSYLISLSLNHQFQKSEAFQSVHHVTFILCYTVLYNFLALVFSLIRVRKLIWEDITQGKQ
jgi:hypothetical protein